MALVQTQIDFEEKFATEADCIEYLRRRRWPEGFRCPRCGSTRAWQLRTRPLDQCASCGRQVSLTAGTVFHGTRKPLRLWFRIMARFLSSKSGCSAMEISRVFGLRYETAWNWLHKLRSLMSRDGGVPLEGYIEADETVVGGRHPDVVGRQLGGKKLLVLGAVEDKQKACGRIRLAVAAAASQAVITAFMTRHVERGSHVRTDGWAGYTPLTKLGYDHSPVSLRMGAASPVEAERNAARRLPKIHRVFSLLKRLLLATYHGGVSRKHLQTYADEFVFRFNRRASASRFLLFERLASTAFRRAPTNRQIVRRSPQLLVAA